MGLTEEEVFALRDRCYTSVLDMFDELLHKEQVEGGQAIAARAAVDDTRGAQDAAVAAELAGARGGHAGGQGGMQLVVGGGGGVPQGRLGHVLTAALSYSGGGRGGNRVADTMFHQVHGLI